MKQFLTPGLRKALYFALLLFFTTAVGLGAATGGSDNPRTAYLVLLFAICSSPLLFVDRLNGPYSIICVLMPVYLLFYGAYDFAALWDPTIAAAASGLLSETELGLLAAALLILAGYFIGVRVGRPRRTATGVKDWSGTTAVLVGVLLWAFGAFATYVWQVEVLNRAFQDIEGRITAVQAMAVTLARLVQPLGLMLVAYRVVVGRNVAVVGLMVAMLAVEFAIGFVGDSKEVAMRGLALVVVTAFLLNGRVPKAWLVIGGLVVVMAFPVFQAYRTEVLSGGKDRGKAAADLGRNLDKALNSRKLGSGNYGYTSALQRTALKPTMERIVRDVGTVASFQQGNTLMLYFAGMIPRVIWPDKPDLSTGQLFNRELRISDFRDVYISVTVLGEMYWNFGWPGVVIGTALIGLLLGFVNARCDLSQQKSVTRLLVLTTTIYLIAIRMEDNIAMTYLVWTRTMFAVWVLHMLFARRRVRQREPQRVDYALSRPGLDEPGSIARTP